MKHDESFTLLCSVKGFVSVLFVKRLFNVHLDKVHSLFVLRGQNVIERVTCGFEMNLSLDLTFSCNFEYAENYSLGQNRLPHLESFQIEMVVSVRWD